MSLTQPNQNTLSIVYQALADLKPRATNPAPTPKSKLPKSPMPSVDLVLPTLSSSTILTALSPATAALKLPKLWALIRFRQCACLP